MAIRDLLWACPACGEPNGIVPGKGGESCRACGARVRRGARATIVLEEVGKPSVSRPAWEWCDLLPQPNEPDDAEPTGRALLREADTAWPLWQERELLGFVERFGPEIPGTLTLRADRLEFAPDPHAAVRDRVWPLLDVTAVQPASSALQLKVRGQPVVSLKFLDCSVRLWERRIQERLRLAFRKKGRGEIVEFQPRVSFR